MYKSISKMHDEKMSSYEKKDIGMAIGMAGNKAIDIAIAEKKITQENIEKWRNWIFKSQEKFIKEVIAEKENPKIDPFSDSAETGQQEIENERIIDKEQDSEDNLQI